MTKILQPEVPVKSEASVKPEVPVKPAEPPPEPPEPTPTVVFSTPADRPTIAKLVQEAKDYTRAAEEHLAVHVLTAKYVASDGMLDPTYGELTIAFGNPLPRARVPVAPPDDPNRPTGAPIPDPLPESEDTWSKRPDLSLCPRGAWSSMGGWSWRPKGRPCTAAPELVPRCSAAEVWKRAKAKRAPTNAIAILDLVSRDDGTQGWNFSIIDELRKVDVELEITDNCAAVVEKQ